MFEHTCICTYLLTYQGVYPPTAIHILLLRLYRSHHLEPFTVDFNAPKVSTLSGRKGLNFKKNVHQDDDDDDDSLS